MAAFLLGDAHYRNYALSLAPYPTTVDDLFCSRFLGGWHG